MSTRILSRTPPPERRTPGESTPEALENGKAGRATEGLRSPAGIRWLLVAGALVTTVCVFHLVRTAWPALPPPVQFLVLVAGALALFGAGDVLRHRLLLRQAGTALLALFGALVPVLACGAATIGVATSAGGMLALGVGTAAIALATRRALARVLRHDALAFPAAVALLVPAPALLPRVAEWTGLDPGGGLLVLASLASGLVLHLGARGLNRELFHRDRRDGRERPVSLVPFLLLGALHVAALASLELSGVPGGLADVPLDRLRFVAFPLLTLGLALVATGDELLTALERAGRTLPLPWPARSRALLGSGFGLVVLCLPLAFLDPTGGCVAATGLLASAGLLAWAIRRGSVGSWSAGFGAAVLGWQYLGALLPLTVAQLRAVLIDWTGAEPTSAALWGAGHLPLFLGLAGLAILLRRLETPLGLRRAHGRLLALHLVALAAVTVLDRGVGLLVLPAAFLAGSLALRVSRRAELLLPTQVAGLLAVLIGTAELTAAGLLEAAPVRAVSLGALMLALLADRTAGRFRRFVDDTGPEALRLASLAPAALLIPLTALHGLMELAGGTASGGLQLLLSGALLLVLGHRSDSGVLCALGVLPLSFGAQALAFVEPAAACTAGLAAAALGLSLGWLALAVSLDTEHPSLRAWRPGAILGLGLNAALAIAWLAPSLALDEARLGALVLLLIAGSLLHLGVRARSAVTVALGIGALVVFAPVQLIALSVVSSWPLALAVAGLGLSLLVALLRLGGTRWLAQRTGLPEQELTEDLFGPGAEAVLQVWLFLGLATALLSTGWETVLLAAALIGTTAVAVAAGQRDRALLLPRPLLVLLAAVHLVVAAVAPVRGALLPVLLAQGQLLFAPLAATVAGWLVLVELSPFRRDRVKRLLLASLLVELALAQGFLAAATGGFAGSAWENATLIASAVVLAVRHLRLALSREGGAGLSAWLCQGWVGLAVLQGFTAGWLSFGAGRSSFILLGAAGLELALAGALARHPRGAAARRPARVAAHVLPLVAGGIALTRVVGATWFPVRFPSPWVQVLPLFLGSLVYVVAALTARKRWPAALLSSLFLGLGLFAGLLAAQGAWHPAFACFAPGLALIALSRLAAAELGPSWSRRLVTAGACFLHATPLIGLGEEITWPWLALLLVTSVAAGAASFGLRSRALLTLATGALLVDLGCAAVLLHREQPLLLWLSGVAFGVSLMAWAAFLEYRREGLLQRLRVFRRQLDDWS